MKHLDYGRTAAQAAGAIKDMVVRGAPAIGITAAYGMAMAQKSGENMEEAYTILAASRPTAVNLKWALDRVSNNLILCSSSRSSSDIDSCSTNTILVQAKPEDN